jgi:hypothetical protein
MTVQFADEKFVIRRSELGFKSQFVGDWRLASEKRIIDLTRFMITAASFVRFPKAKLRWSRRLEFAWSTPIEIINDMWGDVAPQPVEPRELIIDECDPRYKHPIVILRSDFPPHWCDAPTSLIVDFARTIEFAMGLERFPQPDIPWRSHEARAYQAPVEVLEGSDWGFERKQADLADMSKQERKMHEAWKLKLVGQILEKRSKVPHNEWN